MLLRTAAYSLVFLLAVGGPAVADQAAAPDGGGVSTSRYIPPTPMEEMELEAMQLEMEDMKTRLRRAEEAIDELKAELQRLKREQAE